MNSRRDSFDCEAKSNQTLLPCNSVVNQPNQLHAECELAANNDNRNVPPLTPLTLTATDRELMKCVAGVFRFNARDPVAENGRSKVDERPGQRQVQEKENQVLIVIKSLRRRERERNLAEGVD